MDKLTNDEAVRYRKKSQTSSRSNSSKRSDHKHQYEKIIVRWIFGFQWSNRCKICGRIDGNGKALYGYRDFLKPEFKEAHAFSNARFMSVPEIRKKYPGIQIYEIEPDSIQRGDWKYVLVDGDSMKGE